LFKSFFWAGFECATGYNVHKEWVDQVAATQHDVFADEDYRRLREVGISVAREAIRWPLVDRLGRYDFATVEPFLRASRKHGVEIIHDLFHYGYPEDVDLFSEEFPARFADYCYAAARHVAARTDGICYFTPINEPSYFAWAAGEVGLFSPHAQGRGWELKVCLARAAIQGINAIRAACPGARIINVDPMCRVAVPDAREDLKQEVDHFNSNVVFQCFDMLSGRLMPELGGSPEHLDTVGINYYWTSQWHAERPGVPIHSDDPGRLPLRSLLRHVWERYGAGIVITETSHVGEMRADWVRELADEARALLDEGVPLGGICLYPILGMPEWHARHEWAQMGLWDLEMRGDRLDRVLYTPMLEALRQAQQRLEGSQSSSRLRMAQPKSQSMRWGAR
jgi:beta-glucosidase/6-phospho-beta-glucosidase/beta-galactosidase